MPKGGDEMKLRQIREQLGISIGELSAKMGVQPHTISRWETGCRQPDIESIKQLTQILGCTADELIGNPPSTPPEERAAGEDRKAS